MFYQSENLGDIKRSLGPTSTMGDAMQELSTRWKSLSEDDKLPYLEKETADRERYERECDVADELAIAAREERIAMYSIPTGDDGEEMVASSRGARAQQDFEREIREGRARERKRARDENLTAEEREYRAEAKAAKRAEKEERQARRDAEEDAVADRHRKLDKDASRKAADRLKYLLGQSEIFGRLKSGTMKRGGDEKKDDGGKDGGGKNGNNGGGGGGYKSKHNSPSKKKGGRSKKDDDDAPEGEDLDDDDDDEGGGVEVASNVTRS
jgi:membrane protein involved in colicin uptake